MDNGANVALPGVREASARWAERLLGIVKEDGHAYLLLNRFHGVEERLADAVKRAPAQWPLRDPYFGTALERAPLLVRLTMEELPLLDAAAFVAAESAMDPALPMPQVCAWLRSGIDAEKLAGHLLRQLRVHLAGYDKAVFFCYFDPRVMARLGQSLDPRRLAHLLGPVDTWLMPGRNGDLFELRRAAATALDGEDVQWDRELTATLERVAAVNDALRTIHRHGRRVPYLDDKRLDGLARHAASLGLSVSADQGAYAAWAYLWPPGQGSIDEHEGMRRCIALARQGVPLSQSAGTLCNFNFQET